MSRTAGFGALTANVSEVQWTPWKPPRSPSGLKDLPAAGRAGAGLPRVRPWWGCLPPHPRSSPPPGSACTRGVASTAAERPSLSAPTWNSLKGHPGSRDPCAAGRGPQTPPLSSSALGVQHLLSQGGTQHWLMEPCTPASHL